MSKKNKKVKNKEIENKELRDKEGEGVTSKTNKSSSFPFVTFFVILATTIINMCLFLVVEPVPKLHSFMLLVNHIILMSLIYVLYSNKKNGINNAKSVDLKIFTFISLIFVFKNLLTSKSLIYLVFSVLFSGIEGVKLLNVLSVLFTFIAATLVIGNVIYLLFSQDKIKGYVQNFILGLIFLFYSIAFACNIALHMYSRYPNIFFVLISFIIGYFSFVWLILVLSDNLVGYFWVSIVYIGFLIAYFINIVLVVLGKLGIYAIVFGSGNIIYDAYMVIYAIMLIVLKFSKKDLSNSND